MKKKMTSYEASQFIDEIAREVAEQYGVPCDGNKNYYGEHYNDEIMSIESHLSCAYYDEEEIKEIEEEVREIFESYARGYEELDDEE